MSFVENSGGLQDGQSSFNGTLGIYKSQDYGVVSDKTKQLITDIIYVFICAPLSFWGITGNVLNIIVFCKQGFKDSINISLFGLCIADLFSLVTALWLSICFSPLFRNPDLPFESLDVMYVTGGYPHAYFTRITTCITAFITVERCLCISMPLKVKVMFTPSRTKIIIVSIYVIMLSVFAPFFFVNNLEWNFDDKTNKSLLRLVHKDKKVEVESVTFLIQSVFMSTVSFVLTIICTVILIVKLNKKSRWRQTATGGAKASSSQESVSVKEKKIVKMVTFISAIFIMCNVPNSLIIFMIVCVPDFSFTGKYRNMFDVLCSFAVVMDIVNSSVNILVYYKMSSKYKITFQEIFSYCVKKKLLDDVEVGQRK